MDKLIITVNKIYRYMSLGLCLTAIVGFLTSTFVVTMSTTFMYIWAIIAILELLIIAVFSFNIDELSYKTSLSIFIIFSCLNGFTIAPIFLLYSFGSMFGTFIATAGMFAITSFISNFIKRDISNWGKYLIMFLIGLIIATIINIFIASSLLYWITTYIGIIIFVGLIIYDTKKINERILSQYDYTEEVNKKIVVQSALELYLDFINLFLLLLRLFGINVGKN